MCMEPLLLQFFKILILKFLVNLLQRRHSPPRICSFQTFFCPVPSWCPVPMLLNRLNSLQQIITAYMDHGYPPPSSRIRSKLDNPHAALEKGLEGLSPAGRELVSPQKKPSL